MDNKLFSLRERVAIVTGGIGLLGKAHCRALAGAGAHVVVADCDGATSHSFAAELGNAAGVDALGWCVDVTSADSIKALRAEVLRVFGRIDVLVNNAAINDMFENPTAAASQSRFEEYPLHLWQQSLNVNVTGTFLCSQILGQVMAEKGGGSIVNIASTYGVVAPDQSLYRRPDGTQTFYKTPAYPAAKGAVIAFTKFLAAYWGRRGVRVNTLSPGGVGNGQDEFFVGRYADRTPLGRMAGLTDYAGAVVFLASDASAYMTGANLIVDGGWSIW